MAEPKTKKTDNSVGEFLASLEDPEKRKDARAVLRLMQQVTGEKPKMWGSSIVGFGELRYRYASGREGDWFVTGFSPRAQNLTLYLMTGLEKLQPLLKKLGQHSTGKSCLYVRRLADVDAAVLETILRRTVEEARALDRSGRPPEAGAKKRAAAKKRAGAKKKRAGVKARAASARG
ncbi:MAG: DUF1801 domain-containing protein [Labilithrix sp.]|nr:DUF1801 domain-containing protein [Labilithrix sp.]